MTLKRPSRSYYLNEDYEKGSIELDKANSQQPTANSQQPTANSQQPTANGPISGVTTQWTIRKR